MALDPVTSGLDTATAGANLLTKVLDLFFPNSEEARRRRLAKAQKEERKKRAELEEAIRKVKDAQNALVAPPSP